MPQMPVDSILLEAGAAEAEIAPARGALLARLRVDAREILYLDRATLEDATKNVRGGVPILFPFAGRLPDDRFLPAGTTMKQHGFGRNLPWARVEDATAGGDTLRLRLEASAITREPYPYEFAAEHTVRLLPRGAELELFVENRGDRPLPCAPGWHPYFSCPADRKREVTADVAGIADRLTDDAELDFGVPAPPSGRARFVLPGLGRLSLEFSPEMRHLQVWSLPGKPFICLEPFYGPPGTVNGAGRDDVPPGRCRAYFLRIEVGK